MGNFAGFAVVFAAMLTFWLFLAGFTLEEFIAGTITSGFVAIMTSTFFRPSRKNYVTSLLYLLYTVPFYIKDEIVSHIEVIRLIITGRVRPGIMEFRHSHKSDFGTMALANSITMTPGTLTLDTRDGSLFIHWIRVKPDRERISGISGKLLRIWD